MYWILKTEPNNYSFSDLEKDKKTIWDGVRNYQARNNLKTMAIGDLALIYHSVGPREAVGIAKVTKEYFCDPTDDSNTWVAVELSFVKWLKKPISLEQIKSYKELSDLALIKQSRLSVCPVNKTQWEFLLCL